MPSRMLEFIRLYGYKSFRTLELTLGPINVLIGANGSGKSNFLSLFTMLNHMMREELQLYVAKAGGADRILHYGQKVTQSMRIDLWFLRDTNVANGYSCHLVPANERLLVKHEATYFQNFHDLPRRYESYIQECAHHSIFEESQLPRWAKTPGAGTSRVAAYVFDAISSWQVYHFHDTSDSARVKQMCNILENRYLLPDAANLAAYLYFLREAYPEHYRTIVETVRLVAPFFSDFILRPHPFDPEMIRLEWRERGSDLTFGANALPDGMLRFICLATLFLQPPHKLPAIIALDEPELGLHPYAIALLAQMVRSAAQHTQVILATHSVSLVNQFTPEEILVVERVNGASTIRRLERDEIARWMDEYSLGELWEKDVLGGYPTS